VLTFGSRNTRSHPDCIDDAPSYQANPYPAPQSTLIVLQPNGAKYVQVQVNALDNLGLVSATGVGVTIIYYDRDKQIIREVKREFGDEAVGPEYEVSLGS
jgi:hypothetical protein